MRKWICVFLFAFICVSMIGCGGGKKEVTDETISVDLPGLGEISGSYTGTISGAKPIEEGVFESSDSSYKYDGEWKNGLPNGEGTRYIDGLPEAVGTFENGKLVEPNRSTVQFTDDDMTYIILGKYATVIPKGADWQCDYDSATDTAVMIPPTDPQSIVRYGFVKSGSAFDQAKALFEEGHIDFSNSTRKSDFKSNSNYTSYSTSYEHYRYTNETGLADLYVIVDKKNDGTFYCSLETVDGVRDFTELIRKMYGNFIAADVALEKFEKQEAEERALDISSKAAEGDWNYIEQNITLLTAADIINFTTPNSVVRVRGVIDNIKTDSFDLWIEKDGSYYRDDEYNATIPSGISKGDVVEVCTETYHDGSLHKFDGIIAMRKLEDETPVPDIVDVFKASCSEISYQAIMRNPSVARGTVGKVTGTVFQVVETTDTHQKLLVTTQDTKDTFEISYFKEEGADNILEKDIITAYGIFYITDKYITITGASNTVPVLVANYVDY